MAGEKIQIHFHGQAGSGKDTQAAILRDLLLKSGLSVRTDIFSTGDLVRGSTKPGNEYYVYHGDIAPHLANSSNGGLVPDEVIVRLSKIEFLRRYKEGADVILGTGIPRTVYQLEEMDKFTLELEREGYLVSPRHICLDVTEDIARNRAAFRRAEAARLGTEPRRDDLESVVENRLAAFAEHTKPMLDNMRPGRLMRVDGVGTIEEVTRRVLTVLAITPNTEVVARN